LATEAKGLKTFKQLVEKSDHFFIGTVLGVENQIDELNANKMRKKVNKATEREFVRVKVSEVYGIDFNPKIQKHLNIYTGDISKGEFNYYQNDFKFVKNQEYLIFVEKDGEHLRLDNHSQAVYSLQYIGHYPYLISELVPRLSNGGQISLPAFFNLVKKVKKGPMYFLDNHSFRPVHNLERSLSDLVYPRSKSNISLEASRNTARKIASTGQANLPRKRKHQNVSFFWILSLLGLMGAAYRLIWADQEQ
jgi:hypothetical protein